MSFDLRNIRETSNDPMGKAVNDLARRLAKFETQNQLETIDEKEDLYSDGQDVDSIIKYHDELYFTKSFPQSHALATECFSPFEPDSSLVKLMLRGWSLGNQLPDKSNFAHHASMYGEPLPVGSTFDLGIVTGTTKSIALQFNRPTSDFENSEYLQIPDTTDLQVIGLSTGFSIVIRFKVFSLADQGSISQTLFEKIDDSTPTNGMMLQLRSDGKLLFVVLDNAVTYKKETAAATIAINTVYDVFVTYAKSGNVQHIYVNAVDKTLTTSVASINWHNTLTNHDFNIFRRGQGSNDGHVYGDFYMLNYYREKVVSSTEVTRFNTNKWSISNIAFGAVMVSNYFASYSPVPVPSFTSTSFSVTSFTQ